MKKLPDICEYFTPERAQQEEIVWCLTQSYKRHLAFILPKIERDKVQTVVEFGCRTGHLASLLPEKLGYVGLENNQWFVDKAKQVAEGREFRKTDMRHWLPPSGATYDLLMAWFFFKHIPLEELGDMMPRMFRMARFAAFNVQIANHDFDNGEAFHHVFVTEDTIKEQIRKAGHRIVDREVFGKGEISGGGEMQDVAYWTRATA